MSSQDLPQNQDHEWEQTQCCVCDFPSGESLASQSVSKAKPWKRIQELLDARRFKYLLVRCQKCGHVYMNPRPKLEDMGWYYPQAYGPHREVEVSVRGTIPSEVESSIAGTPWYLKPSVRSVPGLRSLYYWAMETHSTIVPDLKEKHLVGLEVGAGNGEFLRRIRGLGWTAEGIEPALEPVERLRKQGFKVEHGSLEQIEITAARYHTVFAWMVVEHLHDPNGAFQKIRTGLREGGLFIFSVPNYGSWEAKFFGQYWYAMQFVHLNHFRVRELKRLLESNGMKLEQVHYQADINNIIGSVGLFLREKFPRSKIGDQLIQYIESPSTLGKLLCAIPAKLLSAFGKSGRMTLVARKI